MQIQLVNGVYTIGPQTKDSGRLSYAVVVVVVRLQ